MMLSRQYIRLVLVGFASALPMALWVLSRWLRTFAYHADFSLWLLASGCGLSVMVALLTVGYRSWQAANTNPVTSLRME
jgi:putative ABC transport system permease protein